MRNMELIAPMVAFRDGFMPSTVHTVSRTSNITYIFLALNLTESPTEPPGAAQLSCDLPRTNTDFDCDDGLALEAGRSPVTCISTARNTYDKRTSFFAPRQLSADQPKTLPPDTSLRDRPHGDACDRGNRHVLAASSRRGAHITIGRHRPIGGRRDRDEGGLAYRAPSLGHGDALIHRDGKISDQRLSDRGRVQRRPDG